MEGKVEDLRSNNLLNNKIMLGGRMNGGLKAVLRMVFTKLWRSNWSRAKFSFFVVIESTFNQLFRSKFLVRIKIVATKLIPAAQKLIKKFKFVQNRSNLYRKLSKAIEKVNIYQLFQIILTFLIFQLIISIF